MLRDRLTQVAFACVLVECREQRLPKLAELLQKTTAHYGRDSTELLALCLAVAIAFRRAARYPSLVSALGWMCIQQSRKRKVESKDESLEGLGKLL